MSPILAMDYSSLVAARPSVEPFSKSSSQTRRAAIVCAVILLVACAALVATVVAVTPHRLILADDNHIDHSLLSMELAVGIPSHSDFDPTGTVHFTVLNSDPMDSVLKKVSAHVDFAQQALNQNLPRSNRFQPF